MHVFGSFEANWPCLFGELMLIDESMQNGDGPDGVKWVCGLQHLNASSSSRQCVVYSIGSNNQWEFEVRMNELLPHCDIFTFNPTVDIPTPPSVIEHKVEFKKWGLAGTDDEEKSMFLLSSIMQRLNHSHIDVLKIDVEGYEWTAIPALDAQNVCPSIGQLMIELHVGEKWFVDGFEEERKGNIAFHDCFI